MAIPIIIGAGPAGMRIARRLALCGDVLVLDGDAASPHATEARPQLLTHIPFDVAQTNDHTASLLLAPRIRMLSGRKIVHIDRHGRRITDDSGQKHEYAQLFLATGASPLRSQLPGSQLSGAQTLYTRNQLDSLFNALAPKNSLVIVGGGLLAVELAALVAKRAKVTMIVRSRLLGRYLEPEMSPRVAQHLKKLGVQVLEQASPKYVLGRDRVTGVELADGRQLAAQQVVLACGIVPNTDLALKAGLKVNQGILVDSGMRTSDASIFAAGDCSQPPWPVMRGNIAEVLHQADLALAGARNEPPPEPSAGQYQECRLGDDDRLVIASSHQPIDPANVQRHQYRCINRALSVTVQKQSVVAFQALLPGSQARRLTELWREHAALSRLELLTLRRLAWLPPRSQQDPLICHCAGVHRSRIRAAIAVHGNDLAVICQTTQVGYSCGGCLEDIKTLTGGNAWRSRLRRWSTLVTLLLMATLIGLLPVWTLPDSVLDQDFAIHRLMTDSHTRSISGYLLTGVILMTLTIRGSRRHYWWHILLGCSALLLLPLHSLGGLVSGAGLSASLVGLMLMTILSGGLVMIHRRLTSLRAGHLIATLMLLAATLIHIVAIYEY